MKTKFTLLVLLALFVSASCSKKNDNLEINTKPMRPNGQHSLITIDIDASPYLRLAVDAAAADRAGVWIDLNNNGKQDKGEKITAFANFNNPDELPKSSEYTATASSVVVHGKVTKMGVSGEKITGLDVSTNTHLTDLCVGSTKITELDVSKNKQLIKLNCQQNQLSELDVSQNIALEELSCHINKISKLDVSQNKQLKLIYCFLNKISGQNMTNFLNSLPNRVAEKKTGSVYIIHLQPNTDMPEQNVCTQAQVKIATDKNWNVTNSNGEPYPGS